MERRFLARGMTVGIVRCNNRQMLDKRPFNSPWNTKLSDISGHDDDTIGIYKGSLIDTYLWVRHPRNRL